MSRPTKRLLALLALLAVLTPLGLWLPALARAGAAWGEWGTAEVARRVGYRPRAMARLEGRWRAPLPDYALPTRGGEGAAGYLVCGALGTGLVVAAAWVVGRAMLRRAKPV